MIEIKTLTQLTLPELQRVADGYITHKKYTVIYEAQVENISLRLQAMPLNKPTVKSWTYDAATIVRYQDVLNQGYSVGAYDGDLLVGIAVAGSQDWNHSMWVWEFHVAEAYRHQGIGKRLMACVADRAKMAGYRVLICETQNVNGNGIDIYRSLGFQVEGIDISYYTNHDYPDGEVAVFMKRRLD